MDYEQALQRWGAMRLESMFAWRLKGKRVDPATVTVTFEFNPGQTCCGGRDPDCYCSLAEEPSADVTIHGNVKGRKSPLQLHDEIPAALFNFKQVLAEIIAAGDGTLTLGDAT